MLTRLAWRGTRVLACSAPWNPQTLFCCCRCNPFGGCSKAGCVSILSQKNKNGKDGRGFIPMSQDLMLTHILHSDRIQDDSTSLVGPQVLGRANHSRVYLHDLRRTRRAVQATTRLAENPLSVRCLPVCRAGKRPKPCIGGSQEPDVTFPALMHPCFQYFDF